ncbi:MAG: TonB-dependent receptor plug domain-containing protein, partial [Bacteroidetes bacterium]|nr:TonB-dependent receptor plug domain-containing protein [Bacteroidota bacterium]
MWVKRYLFSILLLSIATCSISQDTITPYDSVRLREFTIIGKPIIKQNPIENYANLAGSSIETAKILNSIPGVYMHNGTYTTNRITIRGIGSRTQYSSNRVKAYLGEIPLTDGSGNTVLEDLPLNLFNAELINGPASSVYGSGLGGAILLNQKKSSLNNKIELINEMSSFRTFLNSLVFREVRSDWDMEIAFTDFSSDGYRDNNTMKRNNAMVLLNHGKADNKISIMFNMIDLKSEIPSSLDSTDFKDNPSIAAGNWAALNGYEDYTKILSGLSLSTNILPEVDYSGSMFFNYVKQDEKSVIGMLENEAVTYGFRNKLTLDKGKFDMSIGSEWFFEIFDWETYQIDSNYNKSDLSNRNRQNRDYSNVFARLKIDSISSLQISVDGSINVNSTRFILQDRFEPDSMDQSGVFKYRPIYSPGISVMIPIREVKLYSSYYHGFSTPSFDETLLPDGDFNNALKPEQGYELEVGVKGTLKDRFRFRLAAYQIWLSNQLLTKRLTDSTFMTINSGESELKGVELTAEIKSLEWKALKTIFTPTISGNISDNKFINFEDDAVSYANKKIPGIPNYKVNFRLRADVRKKFYA